VKYAWVDDKTVLGEVLLLVIAGRRKQGDVG
jgi:hypothetical protein